MVELAGIIILGILAQWFAWKFKIPAILPLLLIGLLVGPIAAEFLSADGTKWIEPMWNGEKGLFAGESLFYFVSLAISIILFEGGLTLRVSEIKNVGKVITRLITLGSIITFFWGRYCCSLYFQLKLGNFFPFFSTNNSYRTYCNYSDFKKYSIKERCFSSIKMGRNFN